MVRFLVGEGADVNARTNDGRAALMEAARVGDLEVVRFLVANGADINAQTNSGETALIQAARVGDRVGPFRDGAFFSEQGC